MIRIGIRVDGSQNIGMGHIMRCLSLADELARNKFEVIFLSKYKEGIEKIKSKGFKVLEICKNNIFEDNVLFGEICEITQIVLKNKIDIMVCDSYNVNEDYFYKLREATQLLVYIDDVNKFVYPVDLLINGNITGEYLNYKKCFEDEVLLLGPNYNLIRDEFKDLPERVINYKVKEIMITTGGSDPYNICSKVLDILLLDTETVNLKINLIIGAAFTNKELINQKYSVNKNVILHENLEKMSEIMLNSDIAISAGGSTLYELCACGTPVLAFVMADNQEFIVKKLAEEGYIINLGNHTDIDDELIVSTIKQLANSFDLRIKMSKKGRKLIDAKGAERVVSEIIRLRS